MAFTMNGKKTEATVKAVAELDPKLLTQAVAKQEILVEDEPEPVVSTAASSAQIVAALQKKMGANVVVKGNQVPPLKRQETGMFEFDFYTGGGFPRGKYTILYGPFSSGKSNICYKAVARAQKGPAGHNTAVWVDTEGAYDEEWAKKMGVNTEELLLVKPGYGEQAVDAIDALVRAGDVAILVLDSLAATVANKEIEQSVEKFDVGTSSLLIKRLCNKLMYAFSDCAKNGHYPAVILINQTRFKIGVIFGDPETMPGGEAMKFLATAIIRVYGKNLVKESISSTVHAFKEISVTIKKARMAVYANSFSFNQVMVPHEGLTYGDTDAFTTVKKFLQQYELLVKVKGGYEVEGMLFPKLEDMHEHYLKDEEFRVQMHNLVIEATRTKMKFIDEIQPNPQASQQANTVPGMMFGDKNGKEKPAAETSDSDGK